MSPRKPEAWKREGAHEGGGLYACNHCGERVNAKGGRFREHLAEKHGIGGDGHPEGVAVLPPGGPLRDASVDEAAMEASLEGLSREERLRNLLSIVNDTALPGQARVAAEGLIARYQGFLDNPPEEDFEKKEQRWTRMHEKELERIGSAEEHIRDLLRDPVRRGELRRMLERAEKEAAL